MESPVAGLMSVKNTEDDDLLDTQSRARQYCSFAAADFLSASSLTELDDYVATHELQDGGVVSAFERISADEVGKSRIVWVKAANNDSNLFNEIVQRISYVNNYHYNFRLDYFSDLQYSEYAADGHYGGHTDTAFNGEDGHEGRQHMLSFTIQFNDPGEYEGGAFETFYNGAFQEVELKRNSVVSFPSCMPHQVTPVTNGGRKSLVGWVYGPAFC